jgi:hypothetical protein
MSEKTKLEKGNPIIPDPPIPSQVRMSAVPEPPTPIPKESGEEVEVVDTPISFPIDEKVMVEEEVDARPKGTIVIKVFENSPYEVEFSGKVTGSEVDIAWKAMMREYKQWKYKLMKAQEEDKQNENGGI